MDREHRESPSPRRPPRQHPGRPLRILILEGESTYFAGAERVLGYYLQGLQPAHAIPTVALVRESRIGEVVPSHVARVYVPDRKQFSLPQIFRQATVLRRACREHHIDLIHGWGARDWELAAVTHWLTRLPAVGTLHDHPQAVYISPARRRLMRWSARFGLDGVACVSEAVRQECLRAGYRPGRLRVIRNGLPAGAPTARTLSPERPFTIGFLGSFAANKGYDGVFQAIDQIAAKAPGAWRLVLAGAAQDEAGRQLVAQVEDKYQGRPWWPEVRFLGWINDVRAFLNSIDVLLMTSLEFDSLPTVLLEAGLQTLPVVAARVGGVAEIVEDGSTGLLFEVGDWPGAARGLLELMGNRDLAVAMGRAAAARIGSEFTIRRMVTGYGELYRAVGSALRAGGSIEARRAEAR